MTKRGAARFNRMATLMVSDENEPVDRSLGVAE
jgi:hypothetical protein